MLGDFKRTLTLSALEDGNARKSERKDLKLTSIYYFLKGNEFSAFHKIESDEIFYHHAGEPFEMFLISEEGELKRKVLGCLDSSDNEPEFMVHVPAGTWQASRLLNRDDSNWGLVSTVVVPGFQWKHFTLGQRKELCARYPNHKELILALSGE